MRTTLTALASAGAAFAAISPDSYGQAPPAYGEESSSSSGPIATTSSVAVESSSSTYIPSTSSSAARPSGSGNFPSCWAACFKEAGVSSPEATCGDSHLTKCIEESCSDEETGAYKSWLAEQCGGSTSEVVPSTSSAVVGPTGSSSMSHGPSGYYPSSSLSWPHDTSSSYSVGPTGYPSISSSYGASSGFVPSSSGVPGGYGNCTTTYSSVCTETETLIYRNHTEYAPTTITHILTTSLPSGSCSEVPYPITSSSSTPYSPISTSPSVPAYPPSSSEESSKPSGGYGGATTVTDFTTVYTTVCPATETSESEGQTYTKTYDTTSVVTSVYQTTVTIPASGGYSGIPTTSTPVSSVNSSPAGGAPGYGGATTVTDFTTVYTTVCPVTQTSESEGQTYTKTYDTTSVVTSVYPTTVSSPAGGAPGYGGGKPTEITSVRPVTKPFTYGDWTSYYTDFETVTLTSYATETVTAPVEGPTGTEGSPVGPGASYPAGSSPAVSSPAGGAGAYPTTQTQVYETEITTAYTTVCPATESEGMTTSTVSETSTISLTFTVTSTATAYPTSSSVGGGEMPPYPCPTCTSSMIGSSGSGYPTGTYSSKPVDSTSSAPASPTGSMPPCADCWSKCFAKYEVTSERELCGDIEVETCIKTECPMESYNAYEGWLNGYCGSSSTSSGVVGPTGTSSYIPTGTGGPTGTAGPTGTGSSSSCPVPTPTGTCKRCEGQPGDDKYCGLDINTNIYKEGNAPITCNTVEYDWEITTGNVSPDGVERWAILVNGQSPGPKIEANWGDEIVVRVKNSMPESDKNGTTVHWHGIHQKGTPEFDGTPSLSQCPIAPGETFTYKFRATQYGSSWYHSHFALQAYDGLFGPIIIHGPVQEGYEYDGEEFIAIQDWSHVPLNFMYHRLELVQNGQRSSPTLENGLINGMNTFDGAGERWSMTVTKGKTYRLRVLNAAIQSTFKFYIDGHKFKVIAADFVPIEPYETDMVNINNGQRYDVIFTADQPSGNYWMRSDNQAPCSNITNGNDIRAIVHYDDAPEGTPDSTAYTYTPQCIDEAPENLVPIVPWNAGASSDEINKDVVIQPNGATPNLFKWTLSGTAFFSQWSDPTLQSIYQDGTVPTYSGDLAIREDNLGEWIYVIIDSPIPLPHPIHLHGHDFLVLDQGVGLYNAGTASLNLNNPPRRDTAIMPFQPGTVGGYLVVAFYTDNPGVWLMHCHIGWHNAMGFALQIIEGLEEIKETVEYPCQMNGNCDSWHAYAEEYDIVVSDSGI